MPTEATFWVTWPVHIKWKWHIRFWQRRRPISLIEDENKTQQQLLQMLNFVLSSSWQSCRTRSCRITADASHSSIEMPANCSCAALKFVFLGKKNHGSPAIPGIGVISVPVLAPILKSDTRHWNRYFHWVLVSEAHLVQTWQTTAASLVWWLLLVPAGDQVEQVESRHPSSFSSSRSSYSSTCQHKVKNKQELEKRTAAVRKLKCIALLFFFFY